MGYEGLYDRNPPEVCTSYVGGSNPRPSVNQVRRILAGFCETCQFCEEDPECCKKRGCATPRILAGLDALVAQRRSEHVREFDDRSGAIPVPTDLAERFGTQAGEHK